MNTMSHLPSSSSAKQNSRLALWVALIFAGLIVLPSCGIPQLRPAKPTPPLPDTFNGVATCDNVSQLGWCEFFEDPQLTDLIAQALDGNQELRILNEEIQIASNEVLARKGEYLPFVTFGTRADLEKASRFTRDGAVEDQLTVAPGKPFPEPLPDFLVATNVSWELDIWKKLRNARDAASLRYLGTREGRNYISTRLISEVAEKYYELLALDNRLQTLDKTIEIQEQSLETSKAMKEAARGTELAVQRFDAEVRKNQSERLIIQQEIVEVENRLNFLVGRFPQPVARKSSDYLDLQLHALSAGVPAQLVQNRADIREAERELAAAGLDIKVARARFYPSLNISAGFGYEAFNPRYLFMGPESMIYNVGGDLVAPLINKKAIQADYMTANSLQLQKVYEYQRVVLNAFVEVINRLSKVENFGKSIEIKKQQLASLEASVDSATKLFQNARAEYMEVLLAQRDMMEARMVLIETKQQQLAAVVSAYQALGGGTALYSSMDVSMSAESVPPENPSDNSQVPLLAPPAGPEPEQLPSQPEGLPSPDPKDGGRGDGSSLRILSTAKPLTGADYSSLKSVLN
jgi:NodT family efflux transporter outer membrane factor (OMF) lipoprotein